MLDESTMRHSARVSTAIQDNPSRVNVDAAIAGSWMRCTDAYGLDPAQRHQTYFTESKDLSEHRERLHNLLEIARFEMSTLHQRIAGSGYVVLFTDGGGVIINSLTDEALQDMFRKAGLWKGAVWSEEQEGTNAIGTCLFEKRPLIVHRDEHFRVRNIHLTCSAAPIFDPHGDLLAVLDVSSVNCRDSKPSQVHSLALVNLSAALIEHSYFLQQFRASWILRFHSRPEYLGLLTEGMLAFDSAGRILAVNRTAAEQLRSVDQPKLTQCRIDQVFDVNLDSLLGQRCYQPHVVSPSQDWRGNLHFVTLRGPEHHTPSKVGRIVKPTQAPVAMTLESLQGEDPLMLYNVRCARRLMDKDINILLQGETGTGKEAFARAIHGASRRTDKPFVAVNCAAIPENLIESELFGYKHGAFTGARREGMRGKVLQASTGTLFLDEIGDMPFPLQTRLLRVLEDWEVLPLGSETPIPVDLHVITATHHNLQGLVAEGAFREDLYYRLNGFTLTLPALRERTDRALLIRWLLAVESAGKEIHMDEEAFAALDRCPWPGNIRQLRNVLRTAVALCEHGILRLQDLPADIACLPLQDLAQRIHAPASLQRDTFLSSAEREALLRALDVHRWHITHTAAHLGLSRNTLYRKMRKHGIRTPAQR